MDHVLLLTQSMQDSPSSKESGTEPSETSNSDDTAYETNSAELQSFTIGCAVLVPVLHRIAVSKAHMLAPSGSDSSGIVSLPCEPLASSSQQTNTDRKRQSDGFLANDNERDDLPCRKRQRKDDNTKEDTRESRLACPFNVYDPRLFEPGSPEAVYHNCGLFDCETIAQPN